MRVAALLLVGGILSSCIGDPVVQTRYAASPQNMSASTVRRVVATIAQKNGLPKQVLPPDRYHLPDCQTYSDLAVRPGENPHINLTVCWHQRSFNITITEMWIGHPTRKHLELARDLETQWAAAGVVITKKKS